MSTETRRTGGVGMRLVLLLAILFHLSALPADEADRLPGEITRGTLLLQGGTGPEPAPTLATDVTMNVSAMIARVHLEQHFRNPGTGWTEAVYVFPLPDDAAVDHLRIRVGERVIEGEIKEREEAKKLYTQAREEGRRAGLVEQERPNIFTTSVANIGPGEEVTVEIEYQQTVSYRDGDFRLRFPLVVGPRYIPGTPKPALEEQVTLTHGWALDTDRVPDASRITPPVAHPDGGPLNPVSIRIDLDPGVELAWVRSSYHPVRETVEGRVHHIRLQEGAVPADRDFELVWRLAVGNEPRAALFTEQTGAGKYGLFMLMPPGREALDKLTVPRDLTLVIDTSGSMHGASIAQAKAALRLAIDGLRPGERFNLIRFDNRTSALYGSPQPVSPQRLQTARSWIDGLEADGGTEMAPALRCALDGSARVGTRLSQVVFITDGAVGNEEELFGIIRAKLGEARLFTVGIGSAPNSWFMRQAARDGRGSFTHIGKPEEVGEKMGALLQRLEYPALTDIQVRAADAGQVEIYPQPVPDLYPGEPLLVAMRLDTLPGAIAVEGRFGTRPWRTEVNIQGSSQSAGVAVLWARRKIGQLMERHAATRELGEQAQIRAQMVETALAHHLVSRFTSLVAVDVTPVRPADQDAGSQAVKTNLPQGWSYDKVFGMPQTATPAALQIAVGLLLLMTAAWLGMVRSRA